MKRVIDEFFKKEKIEYYAVADYKDARVMRSDLISRLGFSPKSVIIFLVPYFSGEAENFSAYARGEDYHLYIKELEVRFSEHLEKGDKKCHFKLYSDHSPIDERALAASLGLGVLGKNRLLINERYGTYVFIGEIISDILPEELEFKRARAAELCQNCGACLSACPTNSLSGGGECLSAITQKKGSLTKEEASLMCRVGTAWGCDECQRACPYNENPRLTPIPFFLQNTVDELSLELVLGMPEEEFSRRAFSWRGRKTLIRNLEILKNQEK